MPAAGKEDKQLLSLGLQILPICPNLADMQSFLMTFDHSASCWKARKVTCNATFLLSKYVSKKSACLPHSDLEMEELAGQERVSRFEDLVSRLAISDEEQERWS